MTKIIRLQVHTGFVGATHEEEVDYDGQTDKEIEELVEDFRQDVINNYLDAGYEIEDDEED